MSFYGDKSKSFQNHWYKWADRQELEQLYYDIVELVKDMLAELIPQEVEKYLSNIDIYGKLVNSEALAQSLIDSLNRQLH